MPYSTTAQYEEDACKVLGERKQWDTKYVQFSCYYYYRKQEES